MPALGFLPHARAAAADALIRVQSPRLPVFTPLAPLIGMPDSSVDHGALYAGDTALRINEIVSARQAVNDLAPSRLLHQGEREPVPVLGPDRLQHRGIKLGVLTHNLQRPSGCPHYVIGVRR
jgi:hypothetical protein